MSLSCSCDVDDDAAFYYTGHSDYKPLATKRSRKCASCGVVMMPGDLVIEHYRHRFYRTEIEERIYGDCEPNVPLASVWQCEECGDLFLSLDELGFECITPAENMRELVNEYAETYGPEKK